MTKFLVIAFFCILSAALVKSEVDKAELIKQFLEYTDQCMAENGASKADVEDLLKQQPAGNMNAKCMRACVMKRYKVMTTDGKFDKAVAMEHGKHLSDGDAEKMKIATEIVNACAGIEVPADHCEATDVYGKCLHDQAKLHGIEKFVI